jgi:hypothetical protein
MSRRTTLRFSRTGDVWAVVERWAKENGYQQKQSAGNERLYQKGVGFLVAPMMLKVNQENHVTSMQAWIRANIFVRLGSLFILPAEMGIESGGLRGALPRSIARKAVNALLAQLGQPPIQ